MTDQVPSSPPGNTATRSDESANAAPQVPAGPGRAPAQDVLPAGHPEPVLEAAQRALEPTEEGVQVAQQLDGETDEQQNGTPPSEESVNDDDSLESGLEPGAGGDAGGGAQSSGSSLAVAPFFDDGYGNRFGISASGDIVLIGGPGLELPGFDPNLIFTLGGLDTIPAASSSGPVFFIAVASLNGGNGYIFKGIDPDDTSGFSVSSAGDVNGDGFDDLMIGAFRADPNDISSGESYLVFGEEANLAILDAADGTIDGMIELSNLDGTGGYVFKGIDDNDHAGISVASAGDVNGDGLDDLFIGAEGADQRSSTSREGASYLVFGGAANLAALDLADGTADGMIELSDLTAATGYVFKGIDQGDRSGNAVASVGDVNGDGFDDLIIGADQAGDNGEGESYLVFGGAANFQALDLADGTADGMISLADLNGTGGYIFKGIDDGDKSGNSVASAGDVNGDGFDDLIIAAQFADQSGAVDDNEGESYLVFGGAANLAALDLGDGTADGMIELAELDGTTGYVFKGIDVTDRSGNAVASAGDVNGDGFDDLIIGAKDADQSAGDNDEGESYLVFGGAANLAALDLADGRADGMIELASLTAASGYLFKGSNVEDNAGDSVAAAGDVNGDGIDDLIIGAAEAGSGTNDEGEAYVVFGGAANLAALDAADGTTDGMITMANVGPGTGLVIRGIDPEDELAGSVSAAGDVNGDGFDDLIIGAHDADPNGDQSGESYLIYGGDFTGSVEILAGVGSQALAGDALANVINAGSGDDTVDGNGGADVINTGEGDDVIVVPDLAFALIDGGRGKDTLVLDPTVAPLHLDLSALPLTQQLQSLEVIDLTGGHSLTARKLNVIDILGSEGANVLKVLGDGNSKVGLPDGWGFHGKVPDPHGGPLTFQKFVHGSGPVTVLVQDGVTVDPTFQLGTLDGGNGYIFKGIDQVDVSGRSVSSAGDVNGDGFDDLIIGAGGADQSAGNSIEGESYLVLGGAANLATLDAADGAADGMIELSNLDGTNGYVLKGIDRGDGSGSSVSAAGDVNGDGFDDIVIGADDADRGVNNNRVGESYLVFGGAANLAALDLADGSTDGMIGLARLDPTTGYVFKGIDPRDFSGESVSSAGDVNGDGFDDLFIGASFASPNGFRSGESYLVFGGTDNLAALDAADGTIDGMIELADLDGTTGFVFKGIDGLDLSGDDVSSAGDVNGDGFDDLFIGASGANPNGSLSGESYLVFGGMANLLALDLADGTTDGMIELSGLTAATGYLFKGINSSDSTGRQVSSAGDVNGDGFDDLIIGAIGGDQSGGPVDNEGEAYVVFGGAANLALLDGNGDGVIELSALDGTTGYTFKGIDRGDRAGVSVSSAGDVNGDGFGDLIIGADLATPAAGSKGESYVVFGDATNLANLDAADGAIDGMIDLANVGPGTGLLITGIDALDRSGSSVSAAGDVNGDGFDDLIIGAEYAAPNGFISGESYLVYGGDFTGSVDILADGGSQILAGDANDNVINAGSGDDTVDGNGGADVINTGEGDDVIVVPDLAFVLIDGGRGKDTLVLDPTVAPLHLDLSALPLAQQLQSLEVIDLTGGHSLTARKLNVIDLLGSEGANVLKVLGDNASSVSLPDGWGFHGLVADPHGGPLQFQKFVHGSGPVTVLVQDDVTVDPTFQLATLDGGNGYIFKGIDEGDYSGISVSSAGDVDGDGFDDLIIGADHASPNGEYSGESYLVFGGAAKLAVLDAADGTTDGMIELSGLNGTTGYVFKGIDRFDVSGRSVSSAGDVNGDGFDDLIIGAYGADGNGNDTGESYLVFGGAANLAALDGNGDGMIGLSGLNGTAGYLFKGSDDGDLSGRSVSSAGDVNGDGFDDLIVGARRADQSAGDSREGESYLVFGGAANLAALDLANGTSDGMIDLASLNGTTGFIFKGIDAFDYSGFSVSSAGDVDGDGFGDLIIGAYGADGNGNTTGESYLVFGGAANLATLDTKNGTVAADGMIDLADLSPTTGYVIEGIDRFDLSGRSVSSAGDVNGDGFDDLIIGAYGANGNGNTTGESYLVFGGAANLAALDGDDGTTNGIIKLSSLDGTNGFIFKGIDGGDASGRSVASAGDVNGDGFDDLIIGAAGADPNGGNSGESYVVFGGARNLTALDLADGTADGMIGLANLGTGGLLLTGIDGGDTSGASVSAAGDVNGDGFDDLIVGARDADPNGEYSGESYLIYGGDFTGSVEILADGGGQALAGDANANVINAGNGDDTVTGGGGADVLNGGAGDDRLVVGDDGFFRVDGGGGEDVLAFALAATRDFGAFDRTAIQGVEGLDFTNGGGDMVTLGLDDVLAMAVRSIDFLGETGLDNVLSITGDAGDQVNLAAADGWTDTGAGPGAASVFTLYTVDAITLAIEDGVDVVIA